MRADTDCSRYQAQRVCAGLSLRGHKKKGIKPGSRKRRKGIKPEPGKYTEHGKHLEEE